MFGFRNEPSLQKSWLSGDVYSTALVRPVFDARRIFLGDELKARALRDSLESVFEKWRDENGTLPEGGKGLLLVNPYAGKPLEECPPYECAGSSVWDYASLLAKLRAEQYPPLMELEAAADTSPSPILALPGTKLGMLWILAALILSESATANVESATRAYWELDRIKKDSEHRLNQSMHETNKVVYALAQTGAKFVPGQSKRQAKLAFQKVAAPLFESNGYNIDKTIREPALDEFRRKHYGAHTLRDWLREIRPDGTKVRGRPKKI